MANKKGAVAKAAAAVTEAVTTADAADEYVVEPAKRVLGIAPKKPPKTRAASSASGRTASKRAAKPGASKRLKAGRRAGGR
jgi:hypothetical protein